MFWMVISPNSLSFWRAKSSIALRSSSPNQRPIGPLDRISRPTNMLSVIDSAGLRASVW